MAYILKGTYLDLENKVKVRNFLFSKFKKKTNIIGLAGPDINEYIERVQNHGFKNITIYENDIAIFLKQMQDAKTHNFKYVFGNIYDALPNEPNTLYDLDYCCTVRYMSDHIAKFKDNFIMTFSMRIGEKESLSTFFKARGEKVIFKEPKKLPLPHTILHTNNGSEYIFIPYWSTSSMFCITKIK